MNKNILIIDESLKAIERLTMLLTHLTSYSYDVVYDYKSAIEAFKNNSYNYIVIEHNCKNSNEFMEYALTTKKEQKIILLSDSLNCPIDCNTCLTHYRFVRILKPASPDDILKYITDNDKEFTCPNKYRFENIDTLEKLYEFINLDENYFFTIKELKDNTLYIKSKLEGTLRFDELIKIEDLVNKKYFNVVVCHDNSIEIKIN